MRRLLLFCCLLPMWAAAQTYTHADTLRGSITPERAWWDVQHYALDVAFDIAGKSISGSNIITYTVVGKRGKRELQLDLMQPMVLDSVVQGGQSLAFRRDGAAYLVRIVGKQKKGSEYSLRAYFHGTPTAAKRAPWDGGLVWSKDSLSRPWVTVACQGMGPSVWYPNKDHQYDEPDRGAIISMTVPDDLTAVANGKLVGTKVGAKKGTITFTWQVTSTINNYNIIPYIGHYDYFDYVYTSETGKPFTMGFWFLDYHKDRAKQKFLTDAPLMMKAFEHWFGPYPFQKDDYKLVEAPHLGMEHQSAIAYGNGFQNGYLGRDLSNSGWGLKFDFILVHESGHEWFGNHISTADIADMWVHEGFTNYSETLYTDFVFGKAAGDAYCQGTRLLIQNDIPIIGKYGVNVEGSGDMYYKGGNLVHLIRQLYGDDERFRQLLRNMQRDLSGKPTTTRAVEAYISRHLGRDLSKVFDQYLRTTQIPQFDYRIEGGELRYRWKNCIEGFNMPLRVFDATGTAHWLNPTTQWSKTPWTGSLLADPNFYVNIAIQG